MGCIETEVTYRFNADGTYDSEVSFTADEILGGKDLKLSTWQIGLSFPEILQLYKTSTSRFEKNYSAYIRNTFSISGQTVEKLKNNKHVKFRSSPDGTFQFESTIPKLLDEVDPDSKDKVVLIVNVTLPKEVDVANSPDVNGNTVQWTLTRSSFVKGITLKAVSKK
jgi:hypothetical protein